MDSDFEREKNSYAQMFAFEAAIDAKAIRMLTGDPAFDLDAEDPEDRQEISGRACDMMLAQAAQARWCAEDGCCD